MMNLILLLSLKKIAGLAEFVRQYFAFKILKEVDVYTMAAFRFSKTIAESPGFSPALEV